MTNNSQEELEIYQQEEWWMLRIPNNMQNYTQISGLRHSPSNEQASLPSKISTNLQNHPIWAKMYNHINSICWD